MLINEDKILRKDPILEMVAAVNGNGSAKKLKDGVYNVGHFGSSHFLRDYQEYPENLSIGPYGVCDSVDQIFEKCPELITSDRKFVVTVTEVRKENQDPTGGWRWHKWGDYIGTKNPQHEYLYDEEDIDSVFVYHIYEKTAKEN